MIKLTDNQCIKKLEKEYLKDQNDNDSFYNDKSTDSNYTWAFIRNDERIEMIIDRETKKITIRRDAT